MAEMKSRESDFANTAALFGVEEKNVKIVAEDLFKIQETPTVSTLSLEDLREDELISKSVRLPPQSPISPYLRRENLLPKRILMRMLRNFVITFSP